MAPEPEGQAGRNITEPRETERVALSALRRITLERLHRSHEDAVPVTVFGQARAERLISATASLRERYSHITVTAVVARALALALADHPTVNAAITPDHIVRYSDVNLGLAISLPNGELTLAVIHRSQEKATVAIAMELAQLAERARNSSLRLADVRGGTFSLSSIGNTMPGITATALIPAGQSGIMLASGIVHQPVVESGKVIAGAVLPLSLTTDHRIVNGEPAMQFFKHFIALIEEPSPWIDTD